MAMFTKQGFVDTCALLLGLTFILGIIAALFFIAFTFSWGWIASTIVTAVTIFMFIWYLAS